MSAAAPSLGGFLVLWLAIAVLVSVNGLFVAAEVAFAAARPTRLRRLAEEGSVSAVRLLGFQRTSESQGRYFATTQLVITSASIGLGMVAEERMVEYIVLLFEPLGLHDGSPLFLGLSAESFAHLVSVVLAIALLTYLHVVLGEMIPKTFALRQPERVACLVAPVMSALHQVLRPIVWLIHSISRLALRAIRFPSAVKGERAPTSDELERLIAESARVGLIEPGDRNLLLSVFDFGERSAHQVMTPRTRVHAFPVDIDPDALADALAEAPYSRFPVYEGDLDHVVGVLHLKDYLRADLDGKPYDLRAWLRDPRFTPEHLPLSELLLQFQEEREHMTVVVDEYGGTAGIVTLEDVVEELVGEVRDEFDDERPPIHKARAGELLVQGDVLIDDLEAHVDLLQDRPDVETVGGLVLNLLGRPARLGDTVLLGDVRFQVTAVEGLGVAAVRVHVPATLRRS